MAKKEESLATLTEIIQDDKKSHILDDLLHIVQNNTASSMLNEIGEIQQKKDEIKNKHKEITDIFKEVEILQERISEAYGEIYNIKNSDGVDSSQALEDIREAQSKAKMMQESYNGFYDTKDSQGNITQGIVTKLKEACKQIEENKDDIADFKAFYDEIFEGKKDENGKTIQLPLSEFIAKKKEEMEELLEKQKEKFDELYETKENKINKLLPGATSAGLAKAYRTEKRIIQLKAKFWNKVFIVFSSIFFVSLIGFYIYTSFYPKILPNAPEYDALIKSLPLWIFGGFIIYYCTKQIAEYKRLESEYAHKETLNNTYKGYETQIRNAKDEQGKLNEKLLDIVLESAKFNPSATLKNNKGEIPTVSLLEKTIDILPLNSLKTIYDHINKRISNMEK